MTHEEIRSNDIVEKYVQRRLPEAESAAFEEHFFACEECFAQVRTMQDFLGGIRHAAETGLLPPVVERTAAAWFRPAFFLAAAAAVILAVAGGWLVVAELPRVRDQLAAHQRDLDRGRRRIAELESRAKPVEIAANLPLVMLQTSRAGEQDHISLPPGAAILALWMEPDPSVRHHSYRLEVSSPSGETVANLSGLERNSYGAISAAVPATRLASGTYRVRLFAMSGDRGALAAEYRLVIRR